MNMLFATFIVNGLNADVKRKTVFKYLKQKKFKIILLQETHSNVKVEKIWEIEWSNKIEWLHGTNKIRGLAINFKKTVLTMTS